MQYYPNTEANADLVQEEELVLNFWQKEHVFQKSIDIRSKDNSFIFYDGPPFANGLPHYGHLLTGFVKDTVARYQTMLGKRVERRFGWDCHGLPIEHQLFKELKKRKGEVDTADFRKKAHAYAMKYVGIQRAEFKRPVC